MSEDDKDQKTHDPTEKKLADAREKGEIAVSPEMKHAVMLLAMYAVCTTLGVSALLAVGRLITSLWGNAADIRLEPEGSHQFASHLMAEIGSAFLPILGALLLAAMLIPFLQGRPTFSAARLAPKWSKVSPVAGFWRLFGKHGLVEFLKTFLKFALVTGVALYVVWPKARALDQLVGMPPMMIVETAGGIFSLMMKAVLLLVGALALFDFGYQRYAFRKKMQMSLQEIKDEHKDSEGDPHVKNRIRSIQMQSSRKRMMAAVPTASVVITNPTHYAVALKYEHGAMRAPIVVAKGMDAIALKIRELAAEASVPIVESPPLARALHATAEIDQPIPVEQYAAVAEIISYVMSLTRKGS